MSTVVMNKKDEIIMKLVHYFITEENYNPIVVNGVKDEIWLENSEGPYKIVRINSNNIFNKEQLSYDYYKIESVVKQIKKKTFSFKMNTLNILLDVNEDLKIEDTKNITAVPLLNEDLNITDKSILDAFPDINEKLLKDTTGVDLIVNVTKDINEKTEKTNKVYEKTFKPKPIVLTNLIIAICVIVFVIEIFVGGVNILWGEVTNDVFIKLGATHKLLLQNHEIWRLITAAFLHGSLLHILVNMYSLKIIGSQVETFLGKPKFAVIYLVSAITASLLSGAIGNSLSVGASGAIFGLLGALLYFGYHYRTYLGDAIKRQIIPIIVLNLVIGFLSPGIDNFAHIGGLIGGFFTTMALGIDGRSKTYEKVNGALLLTTFIGILSYFIFWA